MRSEDFTMMRPRVRSSGLAHRAGSKEDTDLLENFVFILLAEVPPFTSVLETEAADSSETSVITYIN
jgi:hypothetical protein